MITALPRLRLIPNEFATGEISFGSELTGDTPRLDLSESDTPKAIIKRPTTYTKIRLYKLFTSIRFFASPFLLLFWPDQAAGHFTQKEKSPPEMEISLHKCANFWNSV